MKYNVKSTRSCLNKVLEVEPVLELFKQLEPYEFIMRFIVVCTEITNGILNIIYLAEV